jgi:hypothetical protein
MASCARESTSTRIFGGGGGGLGFGGGGESLESCTHYKIPAVLEEQNVI